MRERMHVLLKEIALVEPVFTTAAYSSFYSFYSEHGSGSYLTKDMGLLNATIVQGWGWSKSLYAFIESRTARQAGFMVGKNVQILTDVNVNNG